jgi:osmotically inducible lipoprotein OsmB
LRSMFISHYHRSVKAKRMKRGDVMTKRLIIWVVSLVMFTLTATACGTVTGAAVGAAGGAAVGAGTGYGAGKGALIGTGVGAVAGAIYDIYKK